MTTLTIDDVTYAALLRRAEERGLTVERWLAEELGGLEESPGGEKGAQPPAAPPPGESAYDAFMRAGAIGFIKGGPSDLATNPKYMEDSGRW